MFNDEYKDTGNYSGNTTGSGYGSYQYSSYSDPDRDPDKKKKKKGGFLRSLALCIVLALVFGVVAGAAFQVTDYIGDQVRGNDAGDEVITDSDEVAAALGSAVQSETSKSSATVTTVYDVSAVADKTIPSLVSITNKSVQEIQSFFGTFTQSSESSGSGIIVGKNDDELLIVTNNHVIEGSEQLNVCFIDEQICSALVKGTDAGHDLAVVAVKLEDIPEETMGKISIAELGNSDDLKIGEPVIAIGNALGYGQSVTTGVVSALNREATIDNVTYSNLIQTDAAINPGNSGGALLNMNGQVIGINSAKLASSEIEGMGYAISISTAEPIIGDLMNRTTRTRVENEEDRGYLGISGVDVTAEIAEQMGVPTGAYVASVVDGSGADQAGLKKGDVITKFDGAGVSSMTSLKDLLTYYEKGETVTIVYERADDGQYVEHTAELTLSDQSVIQQDAQSQNPSSGQKQRQQGR